MPEICAAVAAAAAVHLFNIIRGVRFAFDALQIWNEQKNMSEFMTSKSNIQLNWNWTQNDKRERMRWIDVDRINLRESQEYDCVKRITLIIYTRSPEMKEYSRR